MSENQAQDMVRIALDPEVEKLFGENDVDLFAMLAKDPAVGGQFRRVASHDFPVSSTDNATRMDPLTIAASAAVIVAMGSAIERIIKVLTRRPVVLTSKRYELALDADGKPVLGPDGKSILSTTVTQTYEESKDANAPAWETRVTASEIRIALGKAVS